MYTQTFLLASDIKQSTKYGINQQSLQNQPPLSLEPHSHPSPFFVGTQHPHHILITEKERKGTKRKEEGNARPGSLQDPHDRNTAVLILAV